MKICGSRESIKSFSNEYSTKSSTFNSVCCKLFAYIFSEEMRIQSFLFEQAGQLNYDYAFADILILLMQDYYK